MLRRFLGRLRTFVRGLRDRSDVPVLVTRPPATFLRGLRSDEFINKKLKQVKAAAFKPHDKSLEERKKANFEPSGHDSSINWEDDVGALELLRNDRSNAKAGVARVPHETLTALLQVGEPVLSTQLVCERRALPKNRYHGNIVFLEGLDEAQRLQLCGYLALQAKLVEE